MSVSMQEKGNRSTKVGFTLLCALAVCCSVMYITSDGAESSVLAEVTEPKPLSEKHLIGSGQEVFMPGSIDSKDVIKTGLLYTKTPDTLKKGPGGRERLLDFLDKVEANIAKEVAGRKADIAKIRAHMAKNMALNQEARTKMKKMLLAKMAVNAKKAKDDLAAAMRQVQKQFAEAAALENKRQSAVFRRAKKTREVMRKNKKSGAQNLKDAVAAQQRALATLAQATNEKIKQSNAHIAANSAQIVENAKKARKDLDDAMGAFDNKMNNIAEEAQKGRSKLAAQAAAQDKKFRADSNNQIKTIVAENAKNFADVRETMAKDRAHADAQLSHTTARLDAALHASAALQDKRFSQTVADIAAAKKEATDRVAGFRQSFNADIVQLSAVVEDQSTKLNARVTQLAGVVESNKAEQAHLNAQVNAELKRMAKVGEDRYKQHLKKDAELQGLMAANKADTSAEMSKMRNTFFNELSAIKAQMKKDRAHAEKALSGATTKLFDTLKTNKEAQDKINDDLSAATKAAGMKAADELKDAKEMWASKIGSLHTTVNKLAKKHNKKVLDLAGIVEENAIKDAAGRANLKKIQKANYDGIKTAVADAVHKGEQRALQIEKKMAFVNKKTVEQMNSRITSEISTLRHSINAQISDLALDTKEARAAMKKEILENLDEAKRLAAENLKAAVEWSEGEFAKLHANLEREEKLGGEERAAMKAQNDADKIAAQARLDDATATQASALLSFRLEMCEAIGVNHNIQDGFNDAPKDCGGGSVNKKLSSEYDIMIADAKAVGEQMKSNQQDLTTALEASAQATDEQLAATDAASVARYDATIKAVQDGIKEATERADKKFAGAYVTMAENAKHAEEELSSAVTDLNQKLATAAALEDSRFSKTVKNLATAKAEATAAVKDAKKLMLADMFKTNALLTETQSRLIGDVDKVTADMETHKAQQAGINAKNTAEMARILKLSNKYYSDDKRARGVLKDTIDEHKQVAHDEVAALEKESMATISAVDSEQAELLKGFKDDLEQATEELYTALAEDDKSQQDAQAALEGDLAIAKAKTAASLKSAEELFASRTTSLTNVITANKAFYEDKLAQTTGIVMDWKAQSTTDRAAIRKIRDGQIAQLKTELVSMIQQGEATRKRVEEEAVADIEMSKKTLLTTIAARVEAMADNVFATVQGNRGKIADNYLSLKAYCAAASGALDDAIKKGQGRSLSSVGDLLSSISDLADVDTSEGEGEGFGNGEMSLLFSTDTVKVDGSVSKINGLVNEYITVLGEVKSRWPMGLGYYLMGRTEIAMQDAGALEVDKIEGRNGQYVYINSAAVGLAGKLGAFQDIAVTMTTYESTLAKLTGSIPDEKKAGEKDIAVPAPEWQGN